MPLTGKQELSAMLCFLMGMAHKLDHVSDEETEAHRVKNLALGPMLVEAGEEHGGSPSFLT